MQKKAIELFHLHKLKFSKYILTGLASVGVNNVFLFVFLKFLKTPELNSVIAAWLVSVGFNYITSSIFTFKNRMSKLQLIKYLLLLSFNLFVVKTATTFLLNTSLDIFFINLLVTAIIVPYTYLIYNYYIFTNKKASEKA